jgi:hypothetical protein
MSNGMAYDRRIAELVSQYDARIERLKPCLTQGVATLRTQCTEEMSALILHREAIRRGLLRVSESEEMCPSCARKES